MSLLIATAVPSLKTPLKTLPNPPSPSMLSCAKLSVAFLSSSYARTRVLDGWGREPTTGSESGVLGLTEKKQDVTQMKY